MTQTLIKKSLKCKQKIKTFQNINLNDTKIALMLVTFNLYSFIYLKTNYHNLAQKYFVPIWSLTVTWLGPPWKRDDASQGVYPK